MVRAHVTLGEARLKNGLVEAGEVAHSLGVEFVEVLVRDSGRTGVDPDVGEFGRVITPVVDGVVVVVGVDDGEVGSGWLVAEEDDVALAVGAASGVGVDANAGSPEAEDLGLEGVVDLEVLEAIVAVSKFGVLGGRALVGRGLLRVLGVLLLVPGTSESGEVEVAHTSRVVASDGGSSELSSNHHREGGYFVLIIGIVMSAPFYIIAS